MTRVDLPPPETTPPGTDFEPDAGSRQGLVIGRGTNFEKNFKMRPVRRFRIGMPPPVHGRGFRVQKVRALDDHQALPHPVMPGHPNILHTVNVEQVYPLGEEHVVGDS